MQNYEGSDFSSWWTSCGFWTRTLYCLLPCIYLLQLFGIVLPLACVPALVVSGQFQRTFLFFLIHYSPLDLLMMLLFLSYIPSVERKYGTISLFMRFHFYTFCISLLVIATAYAMRVVHKDYGDFLVTRSYFGLFPLLMCFLHYENLEYPAQQRTLWPTPFSVPSSLLAPIMVALSCLLSTQIDWPSIYALVVAHAMQFKPLQDYCSFSWGGSIEGFLPTNWMPGFVSVEHASGDGYSHVPASYMSPNAGNTPDRFKPFTGQGHRLGRDPDTAEDQEEATAAAPADTAARQV
eukprot:TRINITY_DN114241_c0_g1_i4.p1 TRINITY_DN114241_c0_g1~~TRINITY_DN114241_c0_g1_i4.p1  ORF type:complete len:292 (-),score=-1.37 TRINITY_DN114241_c0_g1_i4:170-1045(-)